MQSHRDPHIGVLEKAKGKKRVFDRHVQYQSPEAVGEFMPKEDV